MNSFLIKTFSIRNILFQCPLKKLSLGLCWKKLHFFSKKEWLNCMFPNWVWKSLLGKDRKEVKNLFSQWIHYVAYIKSDGAIDLQSFLNKIFLPCVGILSINCEYNFVLKTLIKRRSSKIIFHQFVMKNGVSKSVFYWRDLSVLGKIVSDWLLMLLLYLINFTIGTFCLLRVIERFVEKACCTVTSISPYLVYWKFKYWWSNLRMLMLFVNIKIVQILLPVIIDLHVFVRSLSTFREVSKKGGIADCVYIGFLTWFHAVQTKDFDKTLHVNLTEDSKGTGGQPTCLVSWLFQSKYSVIMA